MLANAFHRLVKNGHEDILRVLLEDNAQLPDFGQKKQTGFTHRVQSKALSDFNAGVQKSPEKEVKWTNVSFGVVMRTLLLEDGYKMENVFDFNEKKYTSRAFDKNGEVALSPLTLPLEDIRPATLDEARKKLVKKEPEEKIKWTMISDFFITRSSFMDDKTNNYFHFDYRTRRVLKMDDKAPDGIFLWTRHFEKVDPALISEADAALKKMHANNAAPGYVLWGNGPPAPIPGQKMTDGTIYLGQYAPKERDGHSLGKIFNVYAAPEDLPKTMEYVATVKHIAKLKKWNGYDGTIYATDEELYAAIKNGSYNGGWIIPTVDILCGKDFDHKDTTPDNILAHKDKGALKGTFKMTAYSDLDSPDCYWSSTEYDRGHRVVVVRLSDGGGGWYYKDLRRLSCRPVRLVEASPPALG
jgi:hypothetical protein